MGNTFTSRNEALKKSNVKLQAQQISPFKGESIKWHSWRKKTRAAIGTAGMLDVLDNKEYAKKNPVDNETIYHLLAVATSDGTAAHLVDKYEDDKDGRAAYQEMVAWYEGDELTIETAEDVRAKLDRIYLSTRNTASSYINDFQQYIKQLEDLDESYTTSKTVNIFLSQISDPDYAQTVELCIENKLNIDECIERIRGKERRISREKSQSRRGNLSIRRSNMIEDKEETSSEMNLESYKTEKGFYSVPKHIWGQISKEDREMIKAMNGKIRKQRESQPVKEVERKLVTRRFKNQEIEGTDATEPPRKKLRTVTFRDDYDEGKESGDTGNNEREEAKIVSNRRDVLRFQVKDSKK